VLERFSENPFLGRFYNSPSDWALQVELSFLLDRFELLKNANDVRATAAVISDFTFSKSLVFAGINLPDDEFSLFKRLYDNLAIEAPNPEIVIYLYNDISGLQQYIHMRGRPYEQAIPNNYLTSIENSYKLYFLEKLEIPLLYLRWTSKEQSDMDLAYAHLDDALNQVWPAGIHVLDSY
jgi:deoxyadenosine/deoxycytidine kinase